MLSQDYPAAVPAALTGPWLNIDFKTDAGALQYMMALRSYIYEGMIEADWDAQKNAVRKWFTSHGCPRANGRASSSVG